MLKTKLIRELEQMRSQPFTPPFVLMERVEEAEFRGERWVVLLAHDTGSDEARWLARFPETGDAVFFTEGYRLKGRWDDEHAIFFPDEGRPMNLLGRPVTPSAIEEDEEEGEEPESMS